MQTAIPRRAAAYLPIRTAGPAVTCRASQRASGITSDDRDRPVARVANRPGTQGLADSALAIEISRGARCLRSCPFLVNDTPVVLKANGGEANRIELVPPPAPEFPNAPLPPVAPSQSDRPCHLCCHG